MRKAKVVVVPTPLEYQALLSERLGIEFFVKRDDVAGPSLGGNKARQLEYYFGQAIERDADTILITGAVQSNFVRVAAAVANSLGMKTVVQLENRVSTTSDVYANSGNVLLNKVLGAEIVFYPDGEDEAGADAALNQLASNLEAQGRKPYVIPLGEEHPPLGALGYVDAAHELIAQRDDFEFVVVASGSGSTHSGLLAGLRGAGHRATVIGSCVRRSASLQQPRIGRIVSRLSSLYDGAHNVAEADIQVWDGALAPGYGQAGTRAIDAMTLMARNSGLLLDPVYTAKAFAAVPALVEDGSIPPGAHVCFVHTGGLAGLFAYEDVLSKLLSSAN